MLTGIASSLLVATCMVSVIYKDTPAPVPQAGKSPLKVFLLVGQSNMEGKGSIEHLRQLATDPGLQSTYGHLVDAEGDWVVREDVWIDFNGRRGGLTVGYGWPDNRFGPELQIGNVLGDAFEEQILLIKIAWGGRSLAVDFRPPRSGGQVGETYQQILAQMRNVLEHLNDDFPAYDRGGYEIAGFFWFQGWNDRINQEFNDEYESNLANLIRDVRDELGIPQLPFVIGETGQGGTEEVHPRALSLMHAQAAVAEYPEFRENVRFVSTRIFYESEPRYDGGYHWFGNAENFFNIGDALGKAMLK